MTRVLRGDLHGEPFVATLTDVALTAAIGTREVIAWDRGGRLYSVWREGRTCRRGLSGRALEKWHDAAGSHRRPMTAGEIDALVDEAADCAAGMATVAADRFHGPGTGDVRDVLDRAAPFDRDAARADAARFAAIYGEVGILPPDQYLSLVVHATEGCAFATCTFCDLYQRPFRVRTAAQFVDHLREVRAFMGESAVLRRRSVFLGAANALALPTARLTTSLEAVQEILRSTSSHEDTTITKTDSSCASCRRDEESRQTISIGAFVDACTGARKNAAEYAALARRGLRRVYVGVESGHDPLLALVGKPARRAEAIRTVSALKAGGVDVAVMILVGLGGERFADAHVADTVAALNAMPLTSSDLIYFSDLVAEDSGRYTAGMAARDVRPLAPSARVEQRRRIEHGLAFPAGRPRLATYDLHEFVY